MPTEWREVYFMALVMIDNMTSFNGYEYNDCGVCVNPDKAYDWGQLNDYHFKIKISETPQGWVYGYNYGGKTYGGGGGCRLNNPYKYPSRSKAIVACAEILKSRFSSDKDATKAIAALDRIISEESGKKPRLKQYSIFDYL